MAAQGGYEAQRRPGNEVEATVEGHLPAALLIAAERIPLVDGHHQPRPRIGGKLEDVQILIHHPFLAVEHQHHNMGPLHGIERLDHGEFASACTGS